MTSPTFVFVPGAWHGAWSWQPVARRVREAGRAAITLTLPGLADGDRRAGLRLSDAIDHLVNEILDADLTDVVLVGHSWGGYVITGAAHQLTDRVSKLVYYNAIVPAPGVSMADENADYAAWIRAAIAASPDGSIPMLLEQVPLLLPDAAPEVQALIFDLLTPQPGGYFLDALDLPALSVPAQYILSDNDLALARPGAEFASRIGLTPIRVPGGHDSMLTHPEEVTAALLKS